MINLYEFSIALRIKLKIFIGMFFILFVQVPLGIFKWTTKSKFCRKIPFILKYQYFKIKRLHNSTEYIQLIIKCNKQNIFKNHPLVRCIGLFSPIRSYFCRLTFFIARIRQGSMFSISSIPNVHIRIFFLHSQISTGCSDMP